MKVESDFKFELYKKIYSVPLNSSYRVNQDSLTGCNWNRLAAVDYYKPCRLNTPGVAGAVLQTPL